MVNRVNRDVPLFWLAWFILAVISPALLVSAGR